MTEPTVGTGPKPKPAAGGKIFGVDRKVAIWGGMAVAGGIAYFLYRAHKNKAAAATTPDATSVTTTGTQGEACTDSNGNPGSLDANGNCLTVDQSGSIAALQTELQGVQAAETAAGQTPGPPGPAGPAGPGGTTGSTGPPGQSAPTKPQTPGSLSTGQISPTSARAHWKTVPNSAGGENLYVTQLKQNGKLIRTESTVGDFNSFTGLKPNTAYTWQVIAENHAGNSAWAGPVSFKTT